MTYYDPEPPRCAICDSRLNPYGGGPCCEGVRCKLEREADERLTETVERDLRRTMELQKRRAA